MLLPDNPARGAFGNKLKSLITAVRSGLPFRTHLLQGFDELLEPEPETNAKGYRLGCWRLALTHKEALTLNESFNDSYPEFFDCECPEFNLVFSKLRKIDGKYHDINHDIKFSLCRAVHDIKWNSTIRYLFNLIDRQIGTKKLLGVSVRSWKNEYELDNPLAKHRAKRFNLQNYKEAIQHLLPSVEGVYVSVDNQALEREFPESWQPTINNPLTDTQWMAVKAYILSRCSILIGDKDSTFIEAAWLLGGCRQPVLLL